MSEALADSVIFVAVVLVVLDGSSDGVLVSCPVTSCNAAGIFLFNNLPVIEKHVFNFAVVVKRYLQA